MATNDTSATSTTIEVLVKVGLIIVLALWSFQIVKPFIGPIVWGAIIAVGCYPAVAWLGERLNGRVGLAAGLFTFVALAALIVPSLTLGVAAVNGAGDLAIKAREGSLSFPSPPEGLKTLPLVGAKVHEVWGQSENDMAATMKRAKPQLVAFARWLVAAGVSFGLGLLQFMFALVLAGIFMAKAELAESGLLLVVRRVSDPERGKRLLDVTKNTTRSVVKGILGIAVFQAVAVGIGFQIAGVPFAGLLAGVCLVLAVVQIDIVLVVVPLSIYMFSDLGPVGGTVFLIWNLVIGLSNNVLKPMLLGRGVAAPMVVVFVGAIGGLMAIGILGLFVGPVVLVLFWTLLKTWLDEALEPEEDAPSDEAGEAPVAPAPAM